MGSRWTGLPGSDVVYRMLSEKRALFLIYRGRAAEAFAYREHVRWRSRACQRLWPLPARASETFPTGLGLTAQPPARFVLASARILEARSPVTVRASRVRTVLGV